MNGFFLSRQVRHRIESLAPMLKKNFDILHPDDILNLVPLDGSTYGSTSGSAGSITTIGGAGRGAGNGAGKSSTSLDDLVYFVRKAMRPRFQAMVNELKAQAELRRAAEVARGAATSAVQARRHHHHHHRTYTPILFFCSIFCSEKAFTMNTVVRLNCYYCCCC